MLIECKTGKSAQQVASTGPIITEGSCTIICLTIELRQSSQSGPKYGGLRRQAAKLGSKQQGNRAVSPRHLWLLILEPSWAFQRFNGRCLCRPSLQPGAREPLYSAAHKTSLCAIPNISSFFFRDRVSRISRTVVPSFLRRTRLQTKPPLALAVCRLQETFRDYLVLSRRWVRVCDTVIYLVNDSTQSTSPGNPKRSEGRFESLALRPVHRRVICGGGPRPPEPGQRPDQKYFSDVRGELIF